MKTAEFANSVDPDEVAQNEPPHLDLYYLLSIFQILNMTASMKQVLKFGTVNSVNCYLAL